MKGLIETFANQIEEGLQIGESFQFTTPKKEFSHIVICGLGGSGIGGSFLKDSLFESINLPITTVKGYFLPKSVNDKSLVIISSYSGNTEETLNCFQEALKRNSTICAVSSNGQVKEICRENDLDCVIIPGGKPPRSAFAYSTTQLYFILKHFDLIDYRFKDEFESAVALIKNESESIKSEALTLAKDIADKIPVLYSSDHIESITVRWRQQINENGKQLCWHHVVPEMNHNELVGWREQNDKLAVVFLRNHNDYEKVAKRMELNKLVYKSYTPNIHEVWSKGSNFIERGIYLIHLGDWLSFYLSEIRGFDTTEVKVIDELKANLAQ